MSLSDPDAIVEACQQAEATGASDAVILGDVAQLEKRMCLHEHTADQDA